MLWEGRVCRNPAGAPTSVIGRILAMYEIRAVALFRDRHRAGSLDQLGWQR